MHDSSNTAEYQIDVKRDAWLMELWSMVDNERDGEGRVADQDVIKYVFNTILC